MPMANLALRKGVEDPHSSNLISTAEAATLQLEFRYLAYLTDNEEYWEKVEGVGLDMTLCCCIDERIIGDENDQSREVTFVVSANIYGVRDLSMLSASSKIQVNLIQI